MLFRLDHRRLDFWPFRIRFVFREQQFGRSRGCLPAAGWWGGGRDTRPLVTITGYGPLGCPWGPSWSEAHRRPVISVDLRSVALVVRER